VRFGWSHGDQEVFSKTELVEAFNWEACGRGDGRFDPKKFLAINQEHLKAPRLMPEADYVSRTLPFIQARGLAAPSAERLAGLVPMIRDRATTFVDAAERLDFVFRAELQMDEAAQKKILVPAAAPVLEGLAAALDAVSDWAEAPLEAAADAFVAAQGLAMKDVAQPARVALTGKSASPGLYQVMVALGRDLTLSRVRAGAALAAAAS
jgi:glutamyl-tRNA synthetase